MHAEQTIERGVGNLQISNLGYVDFVTARTYVRTYWYLRKLHGEAKST